jgi:uncharacterized protein (TIGR00730 family)
MKSVLIFCGSSLGNDEQIHEEIKKLGELIAKNNFRLVYGGGDVGLMGMIADEVLHHGGKVAGVIPRFLHDKEIKHHGITELFMVETMHQRKALMCEMSDGVITLPGGFGTLDEFFEMLTWLQLGLHQKPICILNINGFYDLLLKQLDVMVEKGFLKPENRELVLDASSPEEAIKKLNDFKPVTTAKWI